MGRADGGGGEHLDRGAAGLQRVEHFGRGQGAHQAGHVEAAAGGAHLGRDARRHHVIRAGGDDAVGLGGGEDGAGADQQILVVRQFLDQRDGVRDRHGDLEGAEAGLFQPADRGAGQIDARGADHRNHAMGEQLIEKMLGIGQGGLFSREFCVFFTRYSNSRAS